MKKKMWIMISGPYSTGTRSLWHRELNLLTLNCAALEVFEKGHVPIVGVNCALPLIRVANGDQADEIMLPLSLALVERCDACLRIGAASSGADREMQEFTRLRKPIFHDIDDVPDINRRRSTQLKPRG